VTPRFRGLLATLVLVFAAGFAGVGLGKLVFEGADREPTLHEVIHEELRLTPEQLTRIEGLEADFRVRRQAREMEMRAANSELAAAIRDEHADSPRVKAAIGKFHHAMGQLQTEMIQHVFAMRDVLTPEQLGIFDETVISALTADSR